MDMKAPAAGASFAITSDNPLPEGAHVGQFRTRDGVLLRYACFPRTAEPARGTICLVQGRAEFIEKYFETIADFQKRGFAVATFDWRGQGGSERLIRNPGLGYIDSFADYWSDLKSFHTGILLPDCPAPFYLVGHSMGGLVALMAATRDRLMFERILVSAPMLGLDGLPFSMRNMARLGRALSYLGFAEMPVGRRADKPMDVAAFPNNPLTSDKRRYLRMLGILKARPDLGIGPPTVQWFAAAAEAMARAAGDRFPMAVEIPTLILAAACDRVVSTAATELFGLRMRAGRHMVIAGARHELFMEADPIRGEVMAAFDAFITERTG